MATYTNKVRDDNGVVITRATIAVFNLDGTDAAVENVAGDPISNRLSTDEDGNFTFVAVDGLYNLVFTWGGRIRRTTLTQVGTPVSETQVVDIDAMLGAPIADGDFGTFTGTIIPDDSSAREALQALETQLDKSAGAVSTSTALKALPITITNAVFGGSIWTQKLRSAQNADVQAAITADTTNGIYAISTTNSLYYWERQYEGLAKAEWWGCAPNDTAVTNAAFTNAALNVLGLAKRPGLIHSVAGVYTIEVTGNHFAWSGHKQCIHIQRDNTYWEAVEGASFVLKNGQQTDAGGPVELVTWANTRNNIHLKNIRLKGNIAGQTGWTDGYDQNANGNGFLSYGGTGGGSNWALDGCYSEENFSNPFNLGIALGGDPAISTNFIYDVYVRNISGKNCGEGIQFIRVKRLAFNGMRYEQTDGTSRGTTNRGDAIEFAECDGIIGERPEVFATGAVQNSSAIDYFGSSNILITNTLIDGWQNGFGSSRTGGSFPMSSKNCVFNGFVARNILVSGTVIFAPEGNPSAVAADAKTAGSALYVNGLIENCEATPFQTSTADLAHMPAFRMSNLEIRNCRSPIVNSGRKVIWNGGGHYNPKSGNDGLTIGSTASDPRRDVDLIGVTFEGSTARSIGFDPNNPIEMYGIWDALSCAVDGSYLTPGSNVDLTRLQVRSPIFPELYITASTPSVLGVQVLQRFHDVADIKEGTRGQTLTIRASGSLVVTHSTNLRLAGATNFSMATDNELYLRMVTDDQNTPLGATNSYWIETGRKT